MGSVFITPESSSCSIHLDLFFFFFWYSCHTAVWSHAKAKKIPGAETPLETLLWTGPFFSVRCVNTPNHTFAFLLSLYCNILDLTLRIMTELRSPRLSIWLNINGLYTYMIKSLSHACKNLYNWQILFVSLLKTNFFFISINVNEARLQINVPVHWRQWKGLHFPQCCYFFN